MRLFTWSYTWVHSLKQKQCSRIFSPDITLESSNSERWLITSQWVAIVQISNVIRALWKELSECRLIYPKAIRTQSHLRMSIQIWIHHKFKFDADFLKSLKTVLKQFSYRLYHCSTFLKSALAYLERVPTITGSEITFGSVLYDFSMRMPSISAFRD